ncbi:MobA/MobL family protein [Ruegeria sp. B32]|uniref:MobA/MobL family protein n=1 Tax=Ruegeria sp. B32 TaxID=2867020 RepID=UPI0021A4FD60|nr:MobA/MobL family protein [Ruegeria sp. B32]UWR07656.1 MobA/MobL family protein [Ruegeria sp. B32]
MSEKQAAQKTIANLRYIARPAAVKPGDTVVLNLGAGDDPKALQSVMREALRRRAGRGGKKGIRVAEKLMCSLPNDFAGEPAREAVRLIAKRLAAGSPDVKVYAAIHTDRPNNLHAHFLVIDGLETREQAGKRVEAKAKRVRPRSVVRLNDRGRPKELRRAFAGAINEVAEKFGLTMVEHRSFRERHSLKKPRRHRGTKRGFPVGSVFLEQVLFSPIENLFPIEDTFEIEVEDIVSWRRQAREGLRSPHMRG